MKKITYFLALLAASAFTFSAFAQDDFTKGTNYYLLYLDDDTYETLPEGSVAKDLRVNDVTNFLYVWDGSSSFGTTAGPNWNGAIGAYLNWQVGTDGWSGLGFFIGSTTSPVDLTGITSDYTFHIACKTNNTATHLFGFDGDANCTAKVAIGTDPYVDGTTTFEPYTNFTRDGQWHLIEIPVSDLFNLGLKYSAPTSSNVLWLLSGGVSDTNLSMDAIFFYKKTSTGINGAKANKLNVFVTNQTLSVPDATQPIELFSITGVQVKTSNEAIMGIEDVQPGIYIVRSGGLAQKVQIK